MDTLSNALRAILSAALQRSERKDLMDAVWPVIVSRLAADSECDALPPEFHEALVTLHAELDQGVAAGVAALRFLDSIFIAGSCAPNFPVEHALWLSGRILERGQLLYPDLVQLDSVPWNTVQASVPAHLRALVRELQVSVASAAHEVEEGFVSDQESYPDLLVEVNGLYRGLLPWRLAMPAPE